MRLKRRKVFGPPYALEGDALEAEISAAMMFGDPANADVYAPRLHQRVPKCGAWAMVTRRLPPIEGGLDEHLRVGRVFYVEHQSNADDDGFMPDGTYKVVCHSPFGTVHLWPYEYSAIEPARLIDYWQAGEMVFHPEHVETARFSDVTFYARSRGISLADAAVMALGTFAGSIGWFEPRADLAPEMEALADRLNMSLAEHIREHPRKGGRDAKESAG